MFQHEVFRVISTLNAGSLCLRHVNHCATVATSGRKSQHLATAFSLLRRHRLDLWIRGVQIRSESDPIGFVRTSEQKY